MEQHDPHGIASAVQAIAKRACRKRVASGVPDVLIYEEEVDPIHGCLLSGWYAGVLATSAFRKR